jgi:sugar phosphate isomerase/epimerase
MSYEFIYKGSPYGLDPNSGNFFTGYRMKMEQMGLAMDPRTANQLGEINTKLNSGLKTIEMGSTQQNIIDAIPKQHLQEINRLAGLTGMDITFHAPIVEPSGFDRQNWSESNRKETERQMIDTVARAHEVSPKGNMPVTFHSSAQLPWGEEKTYEKVNGERVAVPKQVYLVDPVEGNIVGALKKKKRYFPEEEGYHKEAFNPDKELEKINKDKWSQELGNLNFSVLRGVEQLREAESPGHRMRALRGMGLDENEDSTKKRDKLFEIYKEVRSNPEIIQKVPENLRNSAEDEFRKLDHAQIFLKDAFRQIRSAYNMAYKQSDKESQKKLEAYKNMFEKEIEKGIEDDPGKLHEFAEIVEGGLKVFSSITKPGIYQKLDEFIVDKTSQTFSNVAFETWKKFGDKAPIISIENPPAGGALSTGEDLKKLVEESRKKFVEKAQKEGISQGEAERAAEQMIGVTWDVGHINMLRKHGWEKKELLKETEAVAPMVKHVHLSDNFGLDHTELPMGMGNVPTKEIMERLGKEGFEGKKIIEAGDWWQHFSQQGKNPPVMASLEAFGTPLYPMVQAPYWNQIANTYGNYMAMPTAYFPEQHFSLYGGGFATLPQELGGQVPGRGSRATGTPMD